MKDRPAILGGQPRFTQILPFVKPYLPPYAAVNGRLAEIFASGILTKGHFLEGFEKSVAKHLGVPHAVGVSSCTVGLALAYQALGIAGEVIVPSFTFMATVHALTWVGAIPVFADIDPQTWTVDPASVESKITPKTVAVVGVHTFGNPASVEELTGLTAKYGLTLVFDAAHGFGTLCQGQPVGRYGCAEVFSASPTKLLVTGEGGLVASGDQELADKIRRSREYGNDGSYDSHVPGLNGRMQEFSAILGLESLGLLEKNASRRNEIATVFRNRLGRLPGVGFQKIRPADRSSYKDFVISIESEHFGLTRDALSAALRAEGIDTRNYYDPPLHLQTAYRQYQAMSRGTLPVTEALAKTALSLPIYAGMTLDDIEGICTAIEAVHRHAEEIRKALPVG